ncbi:C-type lectin domain family 9 member A isoform X2 [Plectropomus leopardus]|uniref:C-type lectin domain family 9 member A isoform X2 n=1 Tax=Plectropomus leopardus TaxID=160734 RepID=UPI001C4B20CF|nr:C-type lectin domain family 9 member A isoform X2 [Plectropomus leopardus]
MSKPESITPANRKLQEQKKGAMEMQEINIEGERNEEHERHESMLEVKTEEEEETDHYSKLQRPAEDVYSEASIKTKAGKQADGNTRLYRAACLFLTIICLALLLAVIFLTLKLQTGSAECPKKVETTAADKSKPLIHPTCSLEECQALFPEVQPQRLGCQQCADGWLSFERSCFYLSTFRLSWDASHRNCSERGGSLAVVSSRSIQNFLTAKGKMTYWIGLRQKGATWSWVNNTVLTQSYWADTTSEGNCGILDSNSPPEHNWIKAPNNAYTYFICQLTLQPHPIGE